MVQSQHNKDEEEGRDNDKKKQINIPDSLEQRKEVLSKYMEFYDKLKDIFESGESTNLEERDDQRSRFLENYNQNWHNSQKFQKLMFNIEIKRNLEKSKLEVEYKIKEIEKKNKILKANLKKRSVVNKLKSVEDYDNYPNRKFTDVPKRNKNLYIQQNLLKQKNLINRLKLSLLTIFKNMHINSKHLNDNKYNNIDIEQVQTNCKRFLNNCVYEKQIFENMKREFNGKADFERLYKLLSRTEDVANIEDKENEIGERVSQEKLMSNLGLKNDSAEENSFLTQSPRSIVEAGDIEARFD